MYNMNNNSDFTVIDLSLCLLVMKLAVIPAFQENMWQFAWQVNISKDGPLNFNLSGLNVAHYIAIYYYCFAPIV